MSYVLGFVVIGLALVILAAIARGLLNAARRVLGLLAILVTPIVIAEVIDYDLADGFWVGVLLVILALSPLGRALGRSWQDAAQTGRVPERPIVAAAPAEPPRIAEAPSRSSRSNSSIGSRLSNWARSKSHKIKEDQHARLDTAWEVLAEAAPRAAARITVARRSCDEFLRLDSAATMSTQAIDMRITIMDNIPRAISEYARHSGRATGNPDPVSLEKLLRTIERVSARAEQLMAEIEEESRSELELVRRHIDRKLSSDPFSPT